MQAEVKDAYWALSGTEDLKTQPGPRLVTTRLGAATANGTPEQLWDFSGQPHQKWSLDSG